ncbi:hypothetical protein [Anaerocellum danielii]|uniref:Uncharacterized protein n=1 Tax=Anaerocellum danielii TaxID=1387557 RepID=A0ABZ0U2Y5_9FIRM|nr:hypothetical protein [Caldicellulosiruptor danielii]WPX08075.1 hypothetical protein SOJ16_001929 [Caldicellulosiruptor danielii]
MHNLLNFLQDIFFMCVLSWLTFLSNLMRNIVPDTSFLSDIATFEGVLIGITIPLSLQIVSWTADKYKDQELATFFTKELIYKIQLFFLLPHIAFVIVLRFLYVKNIFALLIIFIWFIANIAVFFFFLQLVKRYVCETDEVFIEKLKKQVEKILLHNENFTYDDTIKHTRRQFLFVTEKLTNIALVKAELGETETVKKIIEEIERIFRQFWNLKK